MSDTRKDPVDLDSLTDDEVMNLDPAQVQALMEQGDPDDEPETPETPDGDEPTGEDDPVGDPDPAASDDDPQGDDPEQPSGEADDPAPEDPVDPNADPAPEGVDPKPASDPEPKPEGQDPKAGDGKPPEGEAKVEEDPAKAKADDPKAKDKGKQADAPKLTPEQTAAVDFFEKVSAPFKADGKDMQVRSPEDAIRLMQMGVNYNRRMAEFKPLRAMDQMLRQHGLNDPAKLSELIDIHKGNPEAIQKLLKDKGIDPLDMDVTKETSYKAPNYQGDPKDIDFQEAIQTTLAAEGGRELINDVNAGWDDQSKEALRDQPTIFQNLLAQKSSGVYGKIQEELSYQRSLGFLNDVPFLQAYHQVGDAMQKAGVFGSPTNDPHSGGPAPVVKPQAVPIDTGPRKAALQPKTEQPNPNLSSTTPPRTAASNGGGEPTPDYSSLSDEDFLKMAPPA